MRVIFFLAILFSCNNQDPQDWVNSLPKPWTIDEDQYNRILPDFMKYFPDFNDRLKAINLWRLGTPYGIFKSGEEKEPDLDPILRIDTTDCTIHVLTSIAMNSSKNWNETKIKMIDIHYKPNEDNLKKPEYKNRWHYTSDRITNNPYTANITSDLVSKVELEEIELTLYRQLVENTERNYNFSTMQAVNTVWDQLLRVTIFRQEFERLGIDAGKEQIEMILS